MTVVADVQKLDPGALVELFVLDATSIPGGTLSRFHAGTNGLSQSVVWQSNVYTPWPVQARGFDKSGSGKLPRPTLAVANVLGTISAMVLSADDLIGAKVTRKRTFARYLDAANFPGGVNPTEDPSQALPDDVFYVDQKSSENKFVVEFALACKMDLSGVRVPLRVVTQACWWQYKGEGCGYVPGPMFDAKDASVGSSALDVCGKRVSSCKARFGATAVLPYGGFPGAGALNR